MPSSEPPCDTPRRGGGSAWWCDGLDWWWWCDGLDWWWWCDGLDWWWWCDGLDWWWWCDGLDWWWCWLTGALRSSRDQCGLGGVRSVVVVAVVVCGAAGECGDTEKPRGVTHASLPGVRVSADGGGDLASASASVLR
jgi:hypothetical protein